jgi:hypothetical protein
VFEDAEDTSAPSPAKQSRRLVNVRLLGTGLDLFTLDELAEIPWRYADDPQ